MAKGKKIKVAFPHMGTISIAWAAGLKKIGVEPYINENTLYRISYVLKYIDTRGLDEKYCILSIKRLDIKEV